MQEKLAILLHTDYLSAIVLFILMIVALLLYILIRYKKIINRQINDLNEKKEKIKSLRQYSYEMELKKVEREHDVEKEIMTLDHTIKTLETSQKEGLKSHVVTMIEAYETKRAQQLERAKL